MKNPFTCGNWLRGDRFVGRADLLDEVLDGDRTCAWIVGTRRLGKTSLLKQLELLAQQPRFAGRYVPLFWDLEGSSDLRGLQEGLLESADAASDRLASLGVDAAELESQDVFGILRSLKRKARERGLKLLLLCDEAEELLRIEKSSPEALPRLRRTFQEGEACLTVLTSTKRLGTLERSRIPETSPFLHGFAPPLYLPHFTDTEAMQLVSQGGFDATTCEAILTHTNKHPYLLQLLCKRLFESGNLEQVLAEIGSDDMVSHFFSVDYECLDTEEKKVLLDVLRQNALPAPETAKPHLYLLEKLGYVRRAEDGWRVANPFFEAWLRRQEHLANLEVERPAPAPAPATPVTSATIDAESSLELLRRAQGGDSHALDRLYERYLPSLQRWATGRVPQSARGHIDLDALLRQTLQRALSWAEPRREGELWDALRQDLLGRIRAELRGRVRQSLADGDSGSGAQQGAERASAEPDAMAEPDTMAELDASASPQELVIGRQWLERYEDALAKLEPEERQAIVMRIEMGCSFEQVAQSLDRPTPAAARMSVCRALVHLAEEMSHA